ncbi:hypothetical protein OH76DRAFT_610653 [Lentinus brumalis]|uniref:Uncharacterized protein n=1 Tax=Lentinus brumalis TaxID=2498619 RepID=A0A371DUS1_9APHY|nr:hypothetical protein OH76DRAFT_610653 [Polyporus brumalis]
MAEDASSTTSHTRTIVIATVASIGGVLFLVVVVALTVYCARRRYRPYRAPANGVIATDAAPIDEDDPGTSGWVEGTWGGDDESTTGRRSNSGKRKRGASNAQSPLPPVPSKPVLPVLPKTKSPTVPQSAMSGVPAFRILSPSQMSHSRADPAPLSPTSSFGNLTSTVPDSATYLLTPAETAAFPGPTRYTNINAKSSDTFLDMGRSFTDADASSTSLSSHHAHPFATAQAVMPSSYVPSRQRSGRDRSDSNQSASSQATVSAALPTAPPSALSAASRGPARGPAKKPSNSDLVSPSPSTITSAAPSSYGNTAGSSVGAGRIVRSPSPSTLPSSSAATTPTSTTTLMPKRQASNAGAGATSRGPAPPRRVDPVDPAMQPPRDPEAYNREKERERERRHERDRDRERDRERQRAQLQGPRQAQPHSHTQPQSQIRGQERTQQQEEQEEQEEQQQQHAQNKGGRRQGMMMSDRDRKRFGFLDVPQDAADSRPPSYRETG